MPKSEKNNSSAVTIGYTIMAAIFGLTFIGYKIDEKIKRNSSFFTLFGLFLGMVYSGYEVWKLIQRSEKDVDKK